jgi:cell division topological specificity factor
MGLLDFFRRQPPSAQVAKERLRIIVAQERGARGGPDYLPLLRRELLEVIRKYVNVDPEAVIINLERDQGHEVLELSVALPEKIQAAKAAAATSARKTKT